MSEVAFLEGISQKRVKTDRLEVAYLEAGAVGAVPVVLVHGNVSCGWFYEDLMLELAARGPYHVYAPDMRGYGDSEVLPVDATRGVRDFSDDLQSFVKALGLPKFHLFGWSLGGSVVIQYAMDYEDNLRSLVLESPCSPFGFGGTKGLEGELVYPDAAGSGGGAANPEFVQRLKDQDTGSDSPFSPRNVMNTYYFKPPFKTSPAREDTYVAAMLTTKTEPGNYPGDFTASPNWPTLAPGQQGVLNSIAASYINQSKFAEINQKPDVLWVRGDSDQIVSDFSFFDFGTLGQLGAVPGWPGAEVFPPQPMVSQMRVVLDKYQANGGSYREEVLADCGHSPHVEKHDEVSGLLLDFFAVH
jgi:pimeloyl-ACP methyl ester carboxylesterase